MNKLYEAVDDAFDEMYSKTYTSDQLKNFYIKDLRSNGTNDINDPAIQNDISVIDSIDNIKSINPLRKTRINYFDSSSYAFYDIILITLKDGRSFKLNDGDEIYLYEVIDKISGREV